MTEKNSDDFHPLNNGEEEIFREIIAYYGEDTINSAALSSSHSPKKRQKKRHLYSALSIISAVVFLTGTMILGGVLVNEKPQLFSENNSSVISSEADKSSSISEPSDTVSNNIFVFSGSDTDITSSKAVSQNQSNHIPSQSKSTSSDIIISDSDDVSSRSTDSSEKNSDNNLIYDTDILNSDIHETLDIPYDSDREYSLPPIPDEGTVTSIHTDLDNNSTTNPYDNVTTGDVLQAGAGIFLMVMSLASSLVLNKLRAKDI